MVRIELCVLVGFSLISNPCPKGEGLPVRQFVRNHIDFSYRKVLLGGDTRAPFDDVGIWFYGRSLIFVQWMYCGICTYPVGDSLQCIDEIGARLKGRLVRIDCLIIAKSLQRIECETVW